MFLTMVLTLFILFFVVLMLYSGVVFVQDNRFFTSAPKDVQEALVDHDERFKGAHALGWILMIVSAFSIAFLICYGAWDGIQNNFSLWEQFMRFFVIFECYKIFDMICFDWFLLTKSHFFQRHYPETEGCESYNHYGFNLKSQLLKLIVIFPILAFLLAFAVVHI